MSHLRPGLPARAGAALAMGVGLAAIAAGCNKSVGAKGGDKAQQPVAVDVAPARIDAVQRTVDVVGTLYGDEDATISNKVPGKIIAIYKDVGDRVEPGEPLAQLLQNDYLLDINQKQAALRETLAKLGLTELPPRDFDVTNLPSVRRAKLQQANAEAKYNRGKQLHEQKTPLLSDQDFEDLRTTLEVARSGYDTEVLISRGLLGEAWSKYAEVLVAEQALRDTTVRAPRLAYKPPALSVMPMAGGDGDGGDDAAATASATGPASGGPSPPASQPASAPASQPSPPAAPAAQPAVVTSPSTRPSGVGDEQIAAGESERLYVVAARFGNEGELAKAVTPLFRLVDDDPIKFRANVPERYGPEVARGQKVKVWIEAIAKPFVGVVSRINPQVDPANRTFQVEILTPNPDHRLFPGRFARGAIDTRMEAGVVFVPASAVASFAGVDKVFVIEDGKAREVIVAVGDRRDDDIEIREGLKGTEVVAASGTSRLATGLPVQVKQAPATAASAP